MRGEQSKLWGGIVGGATIVGTLFTCLSYYDRKQDSGSGQQQSPAASVPTVWAERADTPTPAAFSGTAKRIPKRQAPVIVVEEVVADADDLSSGDLEPCGLDDAGGSWAQFGTDMGDSARRFDAETDQWLRQTRTRWRREANAGDSRAQFNLDLMNDLDKVFPENEAGFVARQRTLAEQGDAEAQYSLGLYYEFGIGGVKKDRAEATKWYLKAANQGHIPAKMWLDEH